MTIRIFVSYCHQDDAHRIRLTKHMAPLLSEKDVEAWFDGDIEPGKAITPEIRKALRETDIFLALGSSDYLHSTYCYRKEYRPMLRKARMGRPRVVVALVGICDWPNTEMARSKMLPNDAKSVEEHGHRNRAYLEIVQGLRRIVRSVRQEKGKAQAETDRLTAQKAKTTAARKVERQRKATEAKPGTDRSKVTKDKMMSKPLSRPSRPATKGTKTTIAGSKAKSPGKAQRPTATRSTRKP